MRWTSALGRRARYILLLFPFLLTLLYFASSRSSFDLLSLVPIHLSFQTHELDEWWTKFFSHIEASQPYAAPVQIDGPGPIASFWQPNTTNARPDLTELSAVDEANIRASHAFFIAGLPKLAQQLPLDPDTTGIVTVAGEGSFGEVISMLLIARQSGSKLPIHIVLVSSTGWIDHFCAHEIRRLNGKCIYIHDVWSKLPSVLQLNQFQAKTVSIMASSFQNVLFLDPNTLPVVNPDPIFDPGSEPFASTGYIAWPDLWTPVVSPQFYTIAGDVQVPPLTARATSDRGVLAIDKARHADTLLLSAYYNYYGADYYSLLLTQSAHSEGNEETIFQAALVLEALGKKTDSGYQYAQPMEWMEKESHSTNPSRKKKGYWDVRMAPQVHKVMRDGAPRSLLLQQIDPREDHRAVMAAIEVADKQDERKQPRRARDVPSRLTQPEGPTTIFNPNDISEFLTESSFLATTGNLTLDHDHAKILFFHCYNGIKLDFFKLSGSKNDKTKPATPLSAEGKMARRLWGDPGWIVERTGRDVEKLLWKDAMEVWCGIATFREACERMREVWDEVY
ncbi:nucleotide-diphospho-sugar transferase [Podospora appendiculata]|uniref:Nucleotide-diphospho-sugar transferase n=1 Tax=Podospora appendiculata TaxID=314037 RepID=A0AAE0XA55_9PEZI|nr:nucleotide-diphospho-sugar transferase [Podospora appendiculata]